jgi:hypothetical protein
LLILAQTVSQFAEAKANHPPRDPEQAARAARFGTTAGLEARA